MNKKNISKPIIIKTKSPFGNYTISEKYICPQCGMEVFDCRLDEGERELSCGICGWRENG